MSHYYSPVQTEVKSNEKIIYFQMNEKKYQMFTDHGVFSKTGLDFGTRLLLETVIHEKPNFILDIGCGYGPIGIVMHKETNASVVMVDVNERAIELAKRNAEFNQAKVDVILSDGLEKVNGKYDLILTNPPIRAGKSVYYQWFKKAVDFLTPNGKLYFVIQKKQGAPSAIKECEQFYKSVEIVEKKSGYYIIKCENNLTI